jgi:hypothetical protein
MAGKMETGKKQSRVGQVGNISRVYPRSTFTATNFDQIRLNWGKKIPSPPRPTPACRADCPLSSGFCPLTSAFGLSVPKSLSRKSVQAVPTCPAGVCHYQLLVAPKPWRRRIRYRLPTPPASHCPSMSVAPSRTRLQGGISDPSDSKGGRRQSQGCESKSKSISYGYGLSAC